MRMSNSPRLLLIILGTSLMTAFAASAQPPRTPPPGQLDVALTYSTSHSNFVPGSDFWLQGGDLEFAFHLPARFSGVASLSGGHTGPGTGGVPLSVINELYGPRYTWTFPGKTHDVSIFGQGLVGITEGFGSTFPASGAATTSASGLAVQAGGGLDVGLSRHWQVRACEVQWLRSQLPNNTTNVQNSLKIGAGLVFRFQAIR
jgi:hypothetical protein